VNVGFANFETVIGERQWGCGFWRCRTWGRRPVYGDEVIPDPPWRTIEEDVGLTVTGCVSWIILVLFI
jgi:hypothetical protein